MIAKEINGPSWGIKKKIDIDELQKKIEEDEENFLMKATLQKLIQIDLVKIK